MIKLYICIGSACHLKGSYNVINSFQQSIEENKLNDKVEICGSFCLGHCSEDVSVKVNDDYFAVKPENAREFFKTEVMSRL